MSAEAKTDLDLQMYEPSGSEAAKRKVSGSIFGVRVRPGLIHEVVRWQRARWRAGTHSVKTRAEVSGGGKKPWRQKGLGKARAGSNTSPVWVGGGIAHGPKPRSYDFALNKKMKKKVLCGAVTARLQEGKCLGLTTLGVETPKTKEAAKVIDAIGLTGKKTLLVLSKEDEVSSKSARNLERVKVLTAEGLNTYDVVNAEYIVFTESGLGEFEQRMQ